MTVEKSAKATPSSSAQEDFFISSKAKESSMRPKEEKEEKKEVKKEVKAEKKEEKHEMKELKKEKKGGK